MPTYDYICDACGKTFQAEQRMSDPPLTVCASPACGAKGTVRRLVGGGAGIIFKGSGFYATDYKKGAAAKGAEAAAAKDPAKGPARDGAKDATGDSGAGSGEKKGEPSGGADKPAASAGTCACGEAPAGSCGGA